MASSSLTRTVSSTGNIYKGTLSMWFKRNAPDQEEYLFENYETSGNRFLVRLISSGQLNMETLQGSSTVMQINTLNQFFDVGSWYHIVIGIDSTLATAADRVKVYINGLQQTSYTDETQPPQNQNMSINEGNPTYVTIGRRYGASNYFDGYMASTIWIDGTQYAASDFGAFDSTSGEWTPNGNPTVSYGTNGFKLTFEDTSNLGDDTSGNTNDLATSGTPIPTPDCPSNNFPKYNNLIRQASISNLNLQQGNLYSGGNGANNWRSVFMTIAAKTGKYYCEMKCIGTDGSSQNYGVSDVNSFNTAPNDSFDFASQPRGYGLNPNGNKVNNGGAVSTGSTYTTNDIISMALDLDNGKIYFAKNGTWYLSGDPTSGSTGTGSFFDITTGYFYSPTVAIYGAADNMSFNFGNGYFRTTAVTSAGTPGTTTGIFEYDVPTGYQPWSTKGINV